MDIGHCAIHTFFILTTKQEVPSIQYQSTKLKCFNIFCNSKPCICTISIYYYCVVDINDCSIKSSSSTVVQKYLLGCNIILSCSRNFWWESGNSLRQQKASLTTACLRTFRSGPSASASTARVLSPWQV